MLDRKQLFDKLLAAHPAPLSAEFATELVHTKALSAKNAVILFQTLNEDAQGGGGAAHSPEGDGGAWEPQSLRSPDDAITVLEQTLARAYAGKDYAAVVSIVKASADMADWARGGAKERFVGGITEMSDAEAVRALRSAAEKLGYKLVKVRR